MGQTIKQTVENWPLDGLLAVGGEWEFNGVKYRFRPPSFRRWAEMAAKTRKDGLLQFMEAAKQQQVPAKLYAYVVTRILYGAGPTYEPDLFYDPQRRAEQMLACVIEDRPETTMEEVEAILVSEQGWIASMATLAAVEQSVGPAALNTNPDEPDEPEEEDPEGGDRPTDTGPSDSTA